jgi:hypothetical protein
LSGVQMGGGSETKTPQPKGGGHALGGGGGWGGGTPMLLTHGVGDEIVTIQVSIRQHTSAYVSRRMLRLTYADAYAADAWGW